MPEIAVAHRGTRSPDGVLVQEAAAGSGVSYGALYDRYATQVFNYCLRLTDSREDAGDATQEAFVNVLRRLQDDDRPVLDFSAYLFAAARHESYALMRVRRRLSPSDSPPEPDERARVADVATDPERAMLLRDSQEAVRAANARLAPRHREVLALREVAGRSYDEIGATMGISENAAAQLIWRARSKLREAMTAGAVASVVATSEDCEIAQLLLNRIEDGEPVDDGDREWLDEHLEECGSCRAARGVLIEAGASYRCWAPVALFAGMRTDTLTRAGELVGADWSQVASSGTAAGSSAGGGATFAGATVAVIAAITVGALGLSRDGDPAPAQAVDQPPAASAASKRAQPANRADARTAEPSASLAAAGAPRTAGAPGAATPAAPKPGAPDRSDARAAPEGPRSDSRPSPPRDGPGAPQGRPNRPPETTPGPNAPRPGAPAPRAEPPTPPAPLPPAPAPTVEPPPAPPPAECSWSGGGNGPSGCPPGHGGVPPGQGGTPPGRAP